MTALLPSEICAVVVTYHPDAGVGQRMEMWASALPNLVVADNGSTDAELAPLFARAGEPAIELIRNAENLGVAAALNIGIRRAIARGFKWVLTLDQDTTVLPDIVRTLEKAYLAFPRRNEIGAIGTNFPERARRRADSTAHTYVEVKTVITAGMLINTAAFEAVDGFRSELFIDGVDEDFCLRLRAAGYAVLQTTAVGMTHPVGSATRHRFIWRDVGVSNHPPLRHYYMTRNRMFLMARHFRSDPRWCLAQAVTQLKMSVYVLLYEADKLAKSRSMLRGAIHAIAGRLGKLDEPS